MINKVTTYEYGKTERLPFIYTDVIEILNGFLSLRALCLISGYKLFPAEYCEKVDTRFRDYPDRCYHSKIQYGHCGLEEF